MKKLYSFIALTLSLLFTHQQYAHAQSVTTGLPTSAGSGSGALYYLTFVIENNNSFAIIVDDIEMYRATGSNGNNFTLFYNPTVLSGPPALPTGWTSITTVLLSTISTTAIHPTFTNLNFNIPANTTYRFAVQTDGSALNYGAAANTPNYFTNAGVAIGNGNYQINSLNVGYWGASTNPRFWCGTVNFHPAVPCTAPPVGGQATAAASSTCINGTVLLNLTGATGGTGQTYQWQSGPSSTGPWTNVGGVLNTSAYTATVPAAIWFRCALTCNSQTVYSAPVQVTTNTSLPAGTYTINSALPTGGTNFQTFSAAAAALECGIGGPVIFNVNATSGPYNEQVTIPSIINGSAINTVTFNCNNRTLSFTNTSASNYAILRLNGSKFVTFKKLNIVASASGTAGFGVLITNGAKRNMIDSCTIDVGITATSSTFGGVLIGSSPTGYLTSTVACDSNIISNNTITGGYAGIISYSTTSPLQQYNQIINNVVKDFYVYGSYFYYNNNLQVVGNDFHRTTRTTVSTFYGILLTTGNTKANISKNRVHNPFTGAPTSTSGGYFLYNAASATAGNENVFSNNAVYNMDGNGTQYILYSLANYGSWYHNTVSCDNQAATTGISYGYYQSSSYTGITFRNNIISMTRSGTGVKYAIYNGATGYTTVYNNNDYYVTGAASNVAYNGAAIATLAAWQTASSQDALSQTHNPSFLAPATGDLTPTNLAMDNLGVPITGITTDILGTSRNAATPDAGAFEFNNCNPPTGLAASAITNSNATLSWNTVAGAVGYEYVVDQVVGNPSGPGTATTATSYGATGLAANTIYYLHVRTQCGPASFSSWATLMFRSCVMSVVTPASTTTFCTGGNVILNAPTPPVGTNYAYQWLMNGSPITGGTSAAYTASATGNYSLLLTNTTVNCTSTSTPPTVVTVGFPPSSAITPTGTAGLCPGSSTTLTTNTAPGLGYIWYLNGNVIPGATSSSYAATQPGNYTANVSSGPGCNSTTPTPTTINMLTPPVASIVPPANTFICQNSILPISANSGSNLAYQWYYNGTPITTNGTGITYNAAQGGNYTVTVTNTTTGCSTTSSALALTTAPLPPATILPSAASTGCDSILMIANAGAGYTYKWKLNNVIIPNATTNPFPATTTGTYAAVVTDMNGCSGTSPNVNITINPSPVSTITYNSPLTFCDGGTVALNSFVQGGVTYSWLRNGVPEAGDTTAQKHVTISGTYNLKLTNIYGCSRISPSVTVVVNPLPTPVITRELNVLSTTTFNYYQWNFNSHPIPGANSQNYTFTKNGGYTVRVADQNGCESTSPLVFVNNVSVSNVAGGTGLKVYPNPVHNIVNIEAAVKVNALITDLAGKVVVSKEDATRIDISNLADGAYMILITDQEGHTLKIEKLFKRK